MLTHNNDYGNAPTIPPLRHQHIIFYAAHLIKMGFTSYSSIEKYAGTVRQWARHNGHADPAVDPITGKIHLSYFRFFSNQAKILGKKDKKNTNVAVTT